MFWRPLLTLWIIIATYLSLNLTFTMPRTGQVSALLQVKVSELIYTLPVFSHVIISFISFIMVYIH